MHRAATHRDHAAATLVTSARVAASRRRRLGWAHRAASRTPVVGPGFRRPLRAGSGDPRRRLFVTIDTIAPHGREHRIARHLDGIHRHAVLIGFSPTCSGPCMTLEGRALAIALPRPAGRGGARRRFGRRRSFGAARRRRGANVAQTLLWLVPPPRSGEVRLAGARLRREIDQRARGSGLCARWACTRTSAFPVETVAMIGRTAHGGFVQPADRQRRDVAVGVRALGIAHLAGRQPYAMISGGERKRCTLGARVARPGAALHCA